MDTGFQFAIAALVSHTIERLKQSENFSFISQYTTGITRVIAGVVAFLTAFGLTTAWVVDPVTGLGTLTFTGIPSTLNMWGTLGVNWFISYWFQKGYYLGMIKPHNAGVKIDDVGIDVKT